MKKLKQELCRLGCSGQRANISVKKTESKNVLVWCPDYDPGCEEFVEVDPLLAAELLALLPESCPIGECEGEENEPSVWDVLISLSSDGYTRTESWIQGCVDQT